MCQAIVYPSTPVVVEQAWPAGPPARPDRQSCRQHHRRGPSVCGPGRGGFRRPLPMPWTPLAIRMVTPPAFQPGVGPHWNVGSGLGLLNQAPSLPMGGIDRVKRAEVLPVGMTPSIRLSKSCRPGNPWTWMRKWHRRSLGPEGKKVAELPSAGRFTLVLPGVRVLVDEKVAACARTTRCGKAHPTAISSRPGESPGRSLALPSREFY